MIQEIQFDPTTNVSVDVVASGDFDDIPLPVFHEVPPEILEALREQLQQTQEDPSITFQAMSVKDEETGSDGEQPVPLDQVTPEMLTDWVSQARKRINTASDHLIDLFAQIDPEQEVVTAQSVEPVLKAQATSPAYMPTGLRIDWLDATVNVAIQVVRNKDLKVYDSATQTFVAEGTLASKGVIPLTRPFAGTMRAAYQEYLLTTTASVFQDGVYLLFYFNSSDNSILDACSFSVYQGVPYMSPLPPANIFPNTADIAIKLLHSKASAHNDPDTPGYAFNVILGKNPPPKPAT